LQKNDFNRLQLLELSGYLENYLWPHFNENVCFEHIFSIVLMINEKFRESIPVFEALTKDSEKFQKFFKCAVAIFSRFKGADLLVLENLAECKDLVAYTQFLTNAFRSLEDPTVRRCTLRYLSLPVWNALSKARLAEELDKFPQIARHWQYLQAQAKKESDEAAAPAEAAGDDEKESPSKHANKKQKTGKKGAAVAKHDAPATKPVAVVVDNSDSTWIPELLTAFVNTVETVAPTDAGVSAVVVKYLERSAELLVDLLSQLPTRRFLNALVDDMHLVVRCRRSKMVTHPQGKLFSQLVDMIESLSHFEVHDQTGKELSGDDVMAEQNARLHKLQTLAFVKYKTVLRDMVFSSTGELGKPQNLRKHLDFLTNEQLRDLAVQLGKLNDHDLKYLSHLEEEHAAANGGEQAVSKTAILSAPAALLAPSPAREYIMEVLMDSLAVRSSQLDALNRLSLYPNEELLWDGNQVPLGNTYSGEHPLALPKLNLQFLTVHDYLLRNFILFRLESAFEIREVSVLV
jgi:intron-binding protein aquarius